MSSKFSFSEYPVVANFFQIFMSESVFILYSFLKI